MNTHALIDLLSTGVAPVPRNAAWRRLVAALLVGLPFSFLIMATLLGLRHDLRAVISDSMFWIKLLFPAALAAAGLMLAQRLGRPGARIGLAWVGLLLLPLLLVWGLGIWQWSIAPESARPALLFGQTWRSCAFGIVLIALPVGFGVIWALRGLAPLRPTAAGAAAGLMAGGAGAAVYALHCPELGAPFLGVWYVAGIALSTLLGAFAGTKLLRW